MDDKLEKEIGEYLKNNLSIVMNYDYYRRSLDVKLLLDGEVISESFESIDVLRGD
jgi:hypothetical protein